MVLNNRSTLCGVFKFSHKSPCCVLAARTEKGGGRAEAEEGRAESVVQSQNTTDAKVAGMKEEGGREKMRRGKSLLNLITHHNDGPGTIYDQSSRLPLYLFIFSL